MKAVYEKPSLQVVELTINAAIADCAASYYNSVDAKNCAPSGTGSNSELFPSGSFGPENDCTVQVSDKCYFSAADAGNESNIFAS